MHPQLVGLKSLLYVNNYCTFIILKIIKFFKKDFSWLPENFFRIITGGRGFLDE